SSYGGWSSDVCSSDLNSPRRPVKPRIVAPPWITLSSRNSSATDLPSRKSTSVPYTARFFRISKETSVPLRVGGEITFSALGNTRSEERRVGKGGRSGW